MSVLSITALTARTVSFCFAPEGVKYRLPDVPWRLTQTGEAPRAGTADAAVTTLYGLDPSTAYALEIDGQTIEFTTPACAGLSKVTDFGAIEGGPDDPEHAQYNAEAFARAIAAVPAGGTLVVPTGKWVCAPIRLKSDMTFMLEEGATLFAPTDRSLWPQLPARNEDGEMLGSWEGLPEACYSAPVHAIGAENLNIVGLGTLDGGGDRGDWWSWHKETRNGARRPRGLHLIDCRNTQLIGFTIRCAPSWTIHPQGCQGLRIVSLNIQAPHDSPNTDGCNPEMCENVAITGVKFSVGDDCIAIKAGKRGDNGEEDHLRPTRNIRITHCLMERGHGGVVIGSEMSGEVTGVVVENCEMVGTDRGLRLKSRRGRGGKIADVRFANVLMDGVQTAFSANCFYHCDADGHDDWVQSRAIAEVNHRTPTIGEIRVENIELHNVCHAAGAFIGLPEAPIGPISISNVDIRSFDPNATPGMAVMADNVRPLKHESIVVEHADVRTDLALSQTTLSLTDR